MIQSRVLHQETVNLTFKPLLFQVKHFKNNNNTTTTTTTTTTY